MCAGVYDSVVPCACAILKTFIGEFLQLYVSNTRHTSFLSVNVGVYINEGTDVCMVTDECICECALVCVPY